MMRRILLCVLFIALLPVWVSGEDNYLYHSVGAEIFVNDAPAAADLFSAWAEKTGGYYLSKSDQYLVIRFPYTKVGEFIDLVEEQASRILRLDPSATDLRDEIRKMSSGIASREEILGKNLEYIDKTDVEGTLEIEREVLRLLQEIEGMKGNLQKYEVDRRYAKAWISLSITEQELPDNIQSSFEWINKVDFFSFLQGR